MWFGEVIAALMDRDEGAMGIIVLILFFDSLFWHHLLLLQIQLAISRQREFLADAVLWN